MDECPHGTDRRLHCVQCMEEEYGVIPGPGMASCQRCGRDADVHLESHADGANQEQYTGLFCELPGGQKYEPKYETITERRDRLRAIPCNIRCWRVGVPSEYVNGKCVECGSPEAKS